MAIFKAVTSQLDMTFSLVLHACTHQHVIIPLDRLVLGRMLLINARWQALDDMGAFRADKVWDGVSFACHAIIARKAILLWRKTDAMKCGFQHILNVSFISSRSI